MMRLTADYWIASESDGLLPYGYDFMADKPLEPDGMSAPNLIRQAATTFAVASYYEYTKDERLRDPLRRALAALGTKSIPVGRGRLQHVLEALRILSFPIGRWKLQIALDRLGLLYQPSGNGKLLSAGGDYVGAFAGGAAVALLAELAYSSASGDQSFAPWRRAWLDGLLALRIPGGGFRHMPTLIDDTDYDNGEGWLALAVYVDRHSDDVQTAAQLADLDSVLIARYSEAPTLAFFGWGAMAAAQRFRTTHDPRFLAYLRRQADLFVERLAPRIQPEDNNCAPLEGVAAMLAVLVASDDAESRRVRDLRSWASQEMDKLPRLQIQPDQQGMELGGEAYLRAPQMASFAGGFVWSLYQPFTRVDAAGHCLSAMVTLNRAKLD